MRPIFWGIIWFVIGMIGWIAFSVLGGVAAGMGHKNPTVQALVYIFGIVFFFSLPVAVIGEIVRWSKNRKKAAAAVPNTGTPAKP
jgi:hypothetical protein